MTRARRTDIDERKDEIISWLEDGMSRLEVTKRISCKYETLRSRLEEWGVSHLKNQGGKGRKGSWNKKDIKYYLVLDGPAVRSHDLKIRLWLEGLKPRHCEECGWAKISEDGRLPLHLDHVNGNHFDNRIENLEILCPNCHSLRPTSGGWQRKYNARVAQLVEAID